MTARRLLTTLVVLALSLSAVLVRATPALATVSNNPGWTQSSAPATPPTDPNFAYAYAGPAVGDLFGNGQKVVVSAFPDGSVNAYTATGAALPNWPKHLGSAVHATPTLADLAGDGRLEVIVTSEDGAVNVWNADGSEVAGFPVHSLYGSAGQRVSPGFFGGVAVGDLFNNGSRELVAASWDFHLYAWSAQGQMLSGFPIRLWDTVFDTPALADIEHNGSGRLDIIIGSDSSGPPYTPSHAGGAMWAFRPTGCPSPDATWNVRSCTVSGWPDAATEIDQVPWASPAAVDLDGTGHFTIIAGTGTNFPDPRGDYVNAWNEDGSLRWSAPTNGRSFGSPAVGDLRGDGGREIASVTVLGTLYVWDKHGAVLWTTSGVAGFAAPVIAPVDASGRNGIWVFKADGTMAGYTGGGAQVVSLRLPGYAPAAPTVADLGSGQPSLVVTSQNGNASVAPHTVTWNTSVIALAGVGNLAAGAWPTNHGNVQNSGRQAPAAVAGLVGAGTSATVTWAQVAGSEPISHTVGWYRDNSGPWTFWTDTGAVSSPFYGVAGHTYDFFAQGATAAALAAGPGTIPQAGFTASGSPSGFGLYGVRRDGTIETASSVPVAAAVTWPSQNIVRGISVLPGSSASAPGGYVVDLFGGIHGFGTAPHLTPTAGAYWPGWDIVRGISVSAVSGGTGEKMGYDLDGWGGVHNFGGAPSVAGSAYDGYWPGWDIARGVATTPDGRGGYVVDGWGGIHNFGTAPRVYGSAYWSGWDIARGITLLPDGRSGYTLDGWGGLHWFGTAGAVASPASGGPYWSGWDIARSVAIQAGTSHQGWIVDGWGGFHEFGGAPRVVTYLPPTIGRDLTTGVSSG